MFKFKLFDQFNIPKLLQILDIYSVVALQFQSSMGVTLIILSIRSREYHLNLNHEQARSLEAPFSVQNSSYLRQYKYYGSSSSRGRSTGSDPSRCCSDVQVDHLIDQQPAEGPPAPAQNAVSFFSFGFVLSLCVLHFSFTLSS